MHVRPRSGKKKHMWWGVPIERSRRLGGVAAIATAITATITIATAPAANATSSLPSTGAGPAILYEPPAQAPQLSNAGPWKAPPILVSGASAYREGEFLYQGFLYDDHGARELPDPTDPRASSEGDLFSKPNGTYTYPTGPGYAENAANLVEFRVKPLKSATAFRITLNTLENPRLIAFTIAIGGTANQTHELPFGANVTAPASLFLTVHPNGGHETATLARAGTNARVKGTAPAVSVSVPRRQIQVTIPHGDWNPGTRTIRFAIGVGLWDAAKDAYLLPGAIASATKPGGAGTAAHPAAFFDVGFRAHEPFPSVSAGTNAVLDAAWWRDQAQGHALAQNTITPFYANVSFRKLARGVTDNSQIPTTGPIDRILASHFEPAQGADFAHECGFGGAANPASCVPEYDGRLEPYAIYVPPAKAPAAGYGLTLLLHSLSANYNQFLGSRNQSEFSGRAIPSIVITPEARGPDQFYEGLGAADVFEVWADVARRYHLNPAYTDIAGYSMGGIGTFKLAAQFPDLFARAQPTVGDESNNDVLASLRNVPVLMWNNTADELVNPALYGLTASKLSSLGYRYELDAFEPCLAAPQPAKCSPLFTNHLELAINDQFAPAAAFLGSAVVDPNPAHVTYVLDGERDRPGFGIVADHAYWLSKLTLRSTSHTASNGDPEGEIDAISHGFGTGDPTPSGVTPGVGTLAGGNLGTLTYVSLKQTWGLALPTLKSDSIDLTATNIATAAIDPGRARVDCNAKLNITTDGPIKVTLIGCHRTVSAS